MNDQSNEPEFDVESHRIRADRLTNEDEDVEGNRFRHGSNLTSDDDKDEDVEGHRFRHGSNLTSDDDEDEDVEGHRLIGTNVQPPRDTDLGGTDR